MTKIIRTITLDADVYEAAQASIDNISGFINETLRTFLIDAKPEMKEVFDAQERLVKLREEIKKQQKIQDEIERKRIANAPIMRLE